MEVNAVSSTPSYQKTKKGATIGAALGAATVGCQYGMISANYAGLKNAAFSVKKERIEILKSIFKSKDLFDVDKTTVSRVIRGAKRAVANPVNIAKNVCGMALIGAGVGLAIDLYKSHKANKSA